MYKIANSFLIKRTTISFVVFLLVSLFSEAQPNDNFYYVNGERVYSDVMDYKHFYLRVSNNSICDSVQSSSDRNYLKRLLKHYKVQILNKGVCDDWVGDTRYIKLVFKRKIYSKRRIKKLYNLIYSWDRVDFFGPLIEESYISGTGLSNRFYFYVSGDTPKIEIDALVEKYGITNLYYSPRDSSTLSVGITGEFNAVFGLHVIEKLKTFVKEPMVKFLTNEVDVIAHH